MNMQTSSKNLVLLALGAAAVGLGCGVSGSSTTGGTTSGAAGSGSSGAAGGTSTAGTNGGAGAGGSGTGAAGDGSVTGAAGSNSSGAAGTPPNTGAAGSGAAGTTGSGGATGAAGVTGTGGATTGAAGAPPSGITIMIGTTVVPKENAIAFLHFGHSNMAGRGVDLPGTRQFFFGPPNDPHAWMYHSGKGFQPAVEPNTAGDGGNNINGMVSGGPGTALVKEAAALAPDKYFISVGFGQSSAYCSQFLPGALYYSKVMAGALELKGKVTWAGIMIYLGITERHGTQADIDNYPQCINKLVTQIRADLGEPNLPLMINDYEMNTTGPLAPGSSFYNAIHPKQLTLPTVVMNSILVPTDTVAIQDDHSTTDDHHFSLDGHKEYVRLMLAAMQQKGWFPWQ
jgi:hypothetical protein